MIHGLPRVGRTSFLKSWIGERPHFARASDRLISVAGVRVIVRDHLAAAEVDAFVHEFRANEHVDPDMRFIVAPADLGVVDALRSSLSGCVQTIDVVPLQLDDMADEAPLLSVAGGPLDVPGPSPTAFNQPPFEPERHWLRGGLPESLAAETDNASYAWRHGLITTLLGRDYTRWGISRATRLVDILVWIANQNGGELDETACPVAKASDLRSAIHVFEMLGIARRLSNYPAGSSAALGKKAKLYMRDSGLLHAALGIMTLPQLRSYRCVGDSWESYAIETLIIAAGERCRPQYYRARGNNGEVEIDLVLDFVGLGRLLAIECKLSANQKAKMGFYRGSETIQATDRFVVHSESRSIRDGSVDRLTLRDAVDRVSVAASE